MSFRNTTHRYGTMAIVFHWVIAFSVIVMLLLGFFMDDISNLTLKEQTVTLHKLLGLFILVLTILRMAWAITNVKPLFPTALPAWQRYAERIGHLLFYILLLALPVTGWIMSTAAGKPPHLLNITLAAPGIVENKETSDMFWNFHSKLAWALLILLLGHSLAALKHHYINKDDILRRMWLEKSR